ncbi:MAG: hypothetical protein RQ936_00265, partial [Gammaproteobacteria bacterium]|nr:hypothetical protein [Gammaproteobacteria bacterium]
AVAPLLWLCTAAPSIANEDSRELVQLPEMMQQHMMSNMRDHLAAINEILIMLAENESEKAADIAESRLGMSSLGLHGAGHMAGFMPEEMQQMGTRMHRAASHFSLQAQVGDTSDIYKALSEITSACAACHAGYRIR